MFERAQVLSCEAQRGRAAVEGASSSIFRDVRTRTEAWWGRRVDGARAALSRTSGCRRTAGEVNEAETSRAMYNREAASFGARSDGLNGAGQSFCGSSHPGRRRRAAGGAGRARALSQHEKMNITRIMREYNRRCSAGEAGDGEGWRRDGLLVLL